MDKDIQRILDNFQEKYRFWCALKIILQDKKFSASEQEKFKSSFGKEKLNKAINFLKTNSYQNSIEIINQNIKQNSFANNIEQKNAYKELENYFK